MREPFGTRLFAVTEERGQLCVGIDPHEALLRSWGLDDDAAGLERFAMTCVEALAGEVAVLKPQSAFFERHGAAGLAVLERAVRAAREAGAVVLLDAKRGDIGSTMRGYAEAYLDQTSPIAVDAMTVSPFLGFESLRPVLDVARDNGAGVFVLALTSNPEGRDVQLASAGAQTVAGSILAAIARENAGEVPSGAVGAVVGATLGVVGEDLAVGGPILAPGYGAQGGSRDDLARIFAGVGRFVLPSTSREVLGAGPDVGALRSAAKAAADDVTEVLRDARR